MAQGGGIGLGTADHRQEMRFLVSTSVNLVSISISRAPTSGNGF
jgi:hypothetical protein